MIHTLSAAMFTPDGRKVCEMTEFKSFFKTVTAAEGDRCNLRNE